MRLDLVIPDRSRTHVSSTDYFPQSFLVIQIISAVLLLNLAGPPIVSAPPYHLILHILWYYTADTDPSEFSKSRIDAPVRWPQRRFSGYLGPNSAQ